MTPSDRASIPPAPWRHLPRLPAAGGRLWIWSGYAALLTLAPLLFTSSLSLTLLSQIGYMVIVCLSHNLLFGQGGMLSFGHAVYTGLGAFCAIHALNAIGAGALPWLPVSGVPLVGGLAGAGVAALLGWVTVQKGANTFAMITLGVGELVGALSLVLPEVFGGEGGITANRVAGAPIFGISFGPQIQVYYLIAAYCFVCTAAMYGLTRTPLGRLLNAVRDNPERVGFIGFDPRVVRYLAFVIAGFFAGIGGGLMALNFEIVTAESVGAARSAGYLLFTFLGGVAFFIGPILGAVLSVLALVLLSELTQAWLLYLGLGFMVMVVGAPGGLAGLLLANLRMWAQGQGPRLVPGYVAVGASSLLALAGAAALVEMLYRLQLDAAAGPVQVFGVALDVQQALHWGGALAVLGAGGALLSASGRKFRVRWAEASEAIERQASRVDGGGTEAAR